MSNQNKKTSLKTILADIGKAISPISQLLAKFSVVLSLAFSAITIIVTTVDFYKLLESPKQTQYEGWFAFRIIENAVVRKFNNRQDFW